MDSSSSHCGSARLQGRRALIKNFFDYARGAIAEFLESSELAWAASINSRSQSVLWTRHLPSGKMPFQFIQLKGFSQREEFSLDVGWNTKQKFPSVDYFSILLERGLPPESQDKPKAACYVPLISDLILGEARDMFELPSFEVNPPTLERLAQAVKDCRSNSGGMKRLRELCEVSDLEDELESAVSNAGSLQLARELFNVEGVPLSTDWQFIDHLTGLRPSDCDNALAGPCAIACVLLAQQALPFLMSEEVRPSAIKVPTGSLL